MTIAVQSQFRSLVELLRHRATEQANDRACAFINEDGDQEQIWTFGELDWRALTLANRLRMLARVGDRALLIFPPGLDFISAYFGCLYAGVIPVPIVPPKRSRLRDSTLSIVRDCRPTLGLTVSSLADDLPAEFAGERAWDAIRWLDTNSDDHLLWESGKEAHDAKFEDVAFLQYTSGSTSAPKGVMVGHGNLLINLEMIKRTLGNSRMSTYVSWVPLYHDMGLILNVMQTIYLGSFCVMMAPAGFVQRPLTWLSAISRYRASVAGGPNFAFDLCVSRFDPKRMEGVDLSQWQLAFNGAEPVRASTIRRFTETFSPYGFDRQAFYPCYGMAEGTLLLSGGQRRAAVVVKTVNKRALKRNRVIHADDGPLSEQQEIVGCGSVLEGERLAIVNPQMLRENAPGHVGEIWAAGPHISQGYWENSQATEETFRAYIADSGEGPFLRTGDLGCILDGELFITGRIKDIIIVRGENHYPQDVEKTVASCHPALRLDCGAAFTIGEEDEEKLVVVQEVERTWRNRLDVTGLAKTIRKAVVTEHELMVYSIIFVRTGSISKTSSGKIQRRLTRQLYLAGQLKVWGAAEGATKVSSTSV